MIIELRGVEFVNKGAELMLHAIMQKVKDRFPHAIFAMELTHRVRPENVAALNIYVKKGRRAALLPKLIRRKLRFILEEEVKVVLDGSGFAFGDQWGSKHADRRLGLKVSAWQAEGKKVILLPQAFGPFADPVLRTITQKIITHADLIFAREKVSYHYLKGISHATNIHLAPDFTNLLPGKIPKNFDATSRQVAIIPNRKMIDKKEAVGKAYHRFLHLAIVQIYRVGLKPYFLIHEGEPDIEIAREINTLLEEPLEIIINPDPLAVKGIIATAHFIVCSRFHGVVSALSQGVPSLSTSWSHKYEMLHQEYDYEEGLIKNIESKEEIEQKILNLADPYHNKQIAQKLLAHSGRQKERSLDMWETVFEQIQQKMDM